LLLLCFGEEYFSEELLFARSHEAKILHFQFMNERNVTSDKVSSFNLFPKSIGQIAAQHNVQELHLTFGQGSWVPDAWHNPISSVPTGIALWVWFDGPNVEQNWKGLQRAIGGLFCASLNFMDSASISPNLTFVPQVPTAGQTLMYAVLPRETVCTENLTPFLRLLPCHDKDGFAALLQSPKELFASEYYSMEIHYINRCIDSRCTSQSQRLTQKVTVVQRGSNRQFSLPSELTRCSVANKTLIYLSTTPKVFETYPLNKTHPSYKLRIPSDQQDFTHQSNKEDQQVPISINRYFGGHGLANGALTLHIASHLNEDVDITLLQPVPNYLRLYFHTLKIESNGKKLQTNEVLSQTQFRLISGDAISPSILELKWHLLAQSVVTVSIEFDRALLHWTKYPPDPNHGFDMGPAVLTVPALGCQGGQGPAWCSSWPASFIVDGPLTVFSGGQQVILPIPDFSMPFNVITITSTAVALFFSQVVGGLVLDYQQLWEGGRRFASVRPTTRFVRFVMNNRVTRYLFSTPT